MRLRVMTSPVGAGRGRRRGRLASWRWRRGCGRRGRPGRARRGRLATAGRRRRGRPRGRASRGGRRRARRRRGGRRGGRGRARARGRGAAPRRGAKEAGGHALGAGEAVLDRLEEVGVGPAVLAHGLAEDRLAWRGGRRARRSCSWRSRRPRRRRRAPIWCGCRGGRRRLEAGLGGEEAGELGLLAAHDVGGLVLAQAGEDADGEAGVAGRRPGEGSRAGRAGDGGVGRLGPAAAGAGHAADDDVGAAAGREPRVDDGEERGLEGVGLEARRRRPGARLRR